MSAPDDDADFRGDLDRSVAGLRVGYSPDLGLFPVEDAVREVVDGAVDRLAAAGATVERVDLDVDYRREELVEEWLTVSRVKYATMARALAEDGVDLLGEHRDDVAPALVELMEAGRDVSGVAYKRTDVARTAVFDAVQDVLADHDLLVSSTLAVPPVRNDAGAPTTVDGETVHPLLGWFLTWPFNWTGHPAASVPAGTTPRGLPIGMQVVGRRFADADVLAASRTLERRGPWTDRLDGLY